MAKSRGDGGKGERGRKGGGQGFYKTPYLMLAQRCPGCGVQRLKRAPLCPALSRDKRKKEEKRKRRGKEGRKGGKRKEKRVGKASNMRLGLGVSK